MKNNTRLSFCLTAVSTLQDEDLTALTSSIEAYVTSGVNSRKAESLAVDDLLSQIKKEKQDVIALLKTQHDSVFSPPAPIEPEMAAA